MPLIGDVQAAGMTSNVLAKQLLMDWPIHVQPTVSVQVKVNSYYVYVLGEVSKAGQGAFEILCYSVAGHFASWRFDFFHQEIKSIFSRVVPNGQGQPSRSNSVPYEEISSR